MKRQLARPFVALSPPFVHAVEGILRNPLFSSRVPQARARVGQAFAFAVQAPVAICGALLRIAAYGLRPDFDRAFFHARFVGSS